MSSFNREKHQEKEQESQRFIPSLLSATLFAYAIYLKTEQQSKRQQAAEKEEDPETDDPKVLLRKKLTDAMQIPLLL